MNIASRMPILDLSMWVESGKIRHTFYRKPMAPNRVLAARSAISQNIKRSTLFSEAMRRLSSMDSQTLEEERNKVLTEFADALRRSGY